LANWGRVEQSEHLASLDSPHPSLLRNDTFPRKGGKGFHPFWTVQRGRNRLDRGEDIEAGQ